MNKALKVKFDIYVILSTHAGLSTPELRDRLNVT
jgi:hypothetical protein